MDDVEGLQELDLGQSRSPARNGEQLMVGRDESSGTRVDPDDWFSDTGAPSVEEPQELTGGDIAAAREPTWLEGDAEPEQATVDNPVPGRRFATAILNASMTSSSRI